VVWFPWEQASVSFSIQLIAEGHLTMPEQTTRALVATCQNCKRTLVLLTDPTGDSQVKFEDNAPVYIECPDCHFTHPYGPSDVQWVHVERSH
jgi:hypothetical protein